MAYIGKSPTGTGVRSRFYYTQTSGGGTTISGTDDNSKTLTFTDGEYIDVYLNGVLLVAGTDYNTNTANTISGLAALANGDVVEVVVYDIFTVADTVSASQGGTFNASVTIADDLTVDTSTLHVDSTNNRVGVGNTSPATALHVSGGAMLDGITVIGREQTTYDSAGAEVLIDAASSTPPLICHVGGSEKIRFQAAGGISFNGDTAAANALDDYEEGTWTPAVNTGSGAISSSAGYYTKVGNQVTVYGQFQVSTNFTSPSIAGLPFTVRNVFSLSIFSAVGAVLAAGLSNGHFIACASAEGGTVINLRDGSDVNDNHLPNTTQSVYRLSLTYQTS